MEISSRSARRWSVLAVVGLLGLAMTLTITSASSAGSSHAVAAKKKHKCKKKKGKKSAAAAKKKKCKRKKAVVVPPTIAAPMPPTPPPPPPGPTVRATLTWNDGSDLDLFVYDPAGNGGYFAEGLEDHPVPDVLFPTDDEDGFGPEKLIDLRTPSTRPFSYTICVADDHDLNGTVATLHYVRADGSSGVFTTSPGQLDEISDQVEGPLEPGAFDPPDENEC